MRTGARRPGRLPIAAALSAVILVTLLATSADVGVTWDEPAYIGGARSYASWFGALLSDPGSALTEASITDAWKVNREHPPLDKLWSAAVWSVAHRFTDDLTARRLGNMVLASVMGGVLYLLIHDAFGAAAGAIAVVALFTMPRFFFHSHLAALDVPAALSVLAVTGAFWRIVDRGHWGWDVLLGLLWGLALATKINAVFVPVTLGLWCAMFRREWRSLRRLAVMSATGAAVFVATWPWLWVRPLEHLDWYFGFVTTTHWKVGQYYLGTFFMPPPWHFPFVMLWAVVPLSLTVLYLVGMLRSVTDVRDGGFGCLLTLSALTPVLAIASGRSMVYDDERLLMAAFPFLAGLAGAGFATLAARSERLGAASPVGVLVLAALAFVPQLVTMVRMYPHYLSYYSEGVGGLPGATRLGLETTYWSETYNLALPILNAQARPNDLVWVAPWSHDVLIYYQTLGRLRPDLVILSPRAVYSTLGTDVPIPRVLPMASADWFVVQHRETTFGEEGPHGAMAALLASKDVVYRYDLDGVPIFTLYRSRKDAAG